MASTDWTAPELHALQSGWAPAGIPGIITGAGALPYMPLTPHEVAVFDRDFRRLAYIQAFERDLSSLLLDEEPFYLFAAGVAKASIGTDPVFGGATPKGNEIGMQLIRAVTVENAGITSPSPAVLSWTKTYGGVGWNNVFGSAATPLDLSQSGLGTGATNLQNRVLLAFSALVDTAVPPLIQEYRHHVENVDYPVGAISWESVSDLAFARLAAPVIVPVNGRFYTRGNVQGTGTLSDSTQLLGLTFAPGSYLAYEA